MVLRVTPSLSGCCWREDGSRERCWEVTAGPGGSGGGEGEAGAPGCLEAMGEAGASGPQTGREGERVRDAPGFGAGKGEVGKAGKALQGVAIRGLALEAALGAAQKVLEYAGV